MKKYVGLLLVFAGALAAQQWSVQLLPPPPEQFFIDQMWSCIITNKDSTSADVRLYRWITREGTEIAHARSNVITIPPGATRITSADIGSVSDEWYHPDYEDIVQRLGALPAGVYTYCIRVEDSTGAVLAQDCREHRGVTPSPPKLLSPPDGSEVTDPYPTFIWTPPVPLPEDVSYGLRIVQVPEEMTPDEAISAAEPWFEQDSIYTTSFTYPMYARLLEDEKEYAWQVRYRSRVRASTDMGESEIWRFAYGPPSDTLLKLSLEETFDLDSLLLPNWVKKILKEAWKLGSSLGEWAAAELRGVTMVTWQRDAILQMNTLFTPKNPPDCRFQVMCFKKDGNYYLLIVDPVEEKIAVLPCNIHTGAKNFCKFELCCGVEDTDLEYTITNSDPFTPIHDLIFEFDDEIDDWDEPSDWDCDYVEENGEDNEKKVKCECTADNGGILPGRSVKFVFEPDELAKLQRITTSFIGLNGDTVNGYSESYVPKGK